MVDLPKVIWTDEQWDWYSQQEKKRTEDILETNRLQRETFYKIVEMLETAVTPSVSRRDFFVGQFVSARLSAGAIRGTDLIKDCEKLAELVMKNS